MGPSHTELTHPLSGPQVSANLKLSEKQEVKKELVSGEAGGEGKSDPFGQLQVLGPQAGGRERGGQSWDNGLRGNAYLN